MDHYFLRRDAGPPAANHHLYQPANGAVGALRRFFRTDSVKRLGNLQLGARGLRRTIRKLALERAYWQRRNVPWYLVTEAQYDTTVIKNLELLRPHRRDWNSVERCLAAREIAAKVLWKPTRIPTLRQLLAKARQGAEMAYQDFGLAVWKHWLPLNMSFPLRWDAPLQLKEAAR